MKDTGLTAVTKSRRRIDDDEARTEDLCDDYDEHAETAARYFVCKQRQVRPSPRIRACTACMH